MSKPIIQVSGLSKQYHIGLREKANRTFREAVTDAFTAPVRNLRNLRRLTRVEDDSPDTIWALRDVTFDVQPGEVVGIVGRNGAGKSTLLKVLTRITEPTSGEILLHGRVASLLEVGTGFHPELTGRENIYLNGTILGMRKHEIDRKFDEIVDFSEIEKFLDTPVKRYSSGMYVRLAFAVAAHLEPEILLVDEVLAVGDAAFQRKCLGKMGDVAKEGRTVLFVSHNMQAIKNLCTKGVLLDKGLVGYSGPVAETVEKYLQNVSPGISGDTVSQSIRSIPKDNVFRYCGVSLTQDDSPVHQVDNSKPLQITVDYDVLEKTRGLRIYFDLCDTEGTLLFRSFNDENEESIPLVEPGRYRSTATIPADFLSPISYQIIVRATIFNVRTFDPKEGIVLKISVERLGRVNKAYFSEPLRGKISPSIHWATIKREN